MSPEVAAGNARRARIESVDLLRGVVMVLMALDHVRDYVGLPLSPTNLATTTVPLFFTRWITHICAPTFFLLTGTGAYLSLGRKSKRELSRFLWTRGLWLIFLEIVPERCLGLQFNFDYRVTLVLILWALGWAMIVLSVLVFLPDWAVTTFGALLICCHNLLDGIQSTNPLFILLHQQATLFTAGQHTVFVAYPLVPWVGVTAVGYGLGQIYRWAPDRRRSFLLRVGLALIAVFVVLRAINGYGDPNRWATQKSAAMTVVSFLNATKQPPSLLFLLMTLGPAMLGLYVFDRRTPQFLRPVLTIGKVPLFYFLLHIPFIHLLAVAICYVRYGHVYWMFQSPDVTTMPFTPPPGWGFSLPWVYLMWVAVVIALYPLCKWWADVKQRSSNPWLSYL